MSKKSLATITIVLVILAACIGAVAFIAYDAGSKVNDESGGKSSGDSATDTTPDDVYTSIVLGTAVTVDGSSITSDPSSAVYLSSASGYAIINIVQDGTYTLSGSADETQIFVDAGDSDEVVLVLDGVTLHAAQPLPYWSIMLSTLRSPARPV